MEKSQVFTLLQALDAGEKKACRKFLASPVFGFRPKVAALFDQLLEAGSPQKKKAAPAAVSKKNVWAAMPVTAERDYKDGQMRGLMSELLGGIRQFLAWKHWDGDPIGQQLHLCKALKSKRLEAPLQVEIARAALSIEQSGARNEAFFRQKFEWHLEAFEASRLGGRQPGGLGLRDALGAFDRYVAAVYLRQACALPPQPGVELGAVSPVLQVVIRVVSEGHWSEEPSVQAWFHCYSMRLENGGSEGHFRQLKAVLAESARLFAAHELYDLYLLAVNYCIRRLNTGDRGFVREAFALYQDGLAAGALLEDGFLSKFTYNNVLLLAIALEEWDWAKDFLEKYQAFLLPKERGGAYRYNLAVYFFRRKDHDRAQEILREVEFRDVFYNIDARRMLIRIFVDAGETQAAEATLDSFLTYLRRHRSIGYHFELNVNFIKFTRSLLQTPAGNKQVLEKLRLRVENGQVAERDWLVSKIVAR